MVNPGAFHGMRKEFLLNEKATYARGVDGGYAADALATIQRRYFKRFPVDLPHDQDPTGDFLANINEFAPEPEIVPPSPGSISSEEYVAEMKRLEERQKMIAFRKAQIKRWLAYQYTKDHNLDPKESGSYNPYRILIHQLTGVGVKKPRQRSAANTWRKTQNDVINAETRKLARLADTPRNDLAALRDRVARTMFNKLSQEERDQWEAQAKEDHQELLKKWEDDMTQPPSTSPADRQRCIQGLASFAKPILDLICEATGWKASLIAGGPEPAHEGRLNVISVHSGTTTGDVKLNFGKAERARYKKYIIPAFGSFLQLCYSPEECKSRSLPQEEGFEPLCVADGTREEDGIFIDAYSPVPSRSQTPHAHLGRSISSSSHQRTSSPTPRTLSSSSSFPHPPIEAVPQPAAAVESAALQSPYRTNQNVIIQSMNSPTPFSVNISPPPSPRSPARPAVITLHKQQDSIDEHLAMSPSHISPTLQGKRKHAAEEASATPRSNKCLCASPQQRPPSPQIAGPSMQDLQSPPIQPTPVADIQEPPSTPLNPPTPMTDIQGPSSTLNPETPPPEWFKLAVSMLEDTNLGQEWANLVRIWSDFETKHQYQEITRLRAQNRPSVLKDWIQRARPHPSSWVPTISNILKYEKEFMRWWCALQPKWRIDENGDIATGSSGDWEPLRKPGVNGIVTVMAGLYYWGLACQKKRGFSQSWKKAVLDCSFVMDKLSTLPIDSLAQ